MGRHWVSNDDFEYPLNPNLRYTMATMNTMRAEWQYWSTQANILQELCEEKNIQIPRRRSKNMSIDTLQLLQRALHRICEEVN
ncbi:hypothetical protein ACSBR2_003853 [Camellia fascicularis]